MENREKKYRRHERPTILSGSLSQRLSGYSLAATAAGVAALACAIPAEGAPVCKSASVDLFHTTTHPINPASQLAAPFNLVQTTYNYYFSTTGNSHLSWWNRGFLVPNSGGAQLLLGSNSLPANLATGASIGPGEKFGKGTSYGLLFTYGRGSIGNRGHGTLKKHRGNFNLQQANYIGFQFRKDGEVHYGWMRLAVKLIPENYRRTDYFDTESRILGYGYESAPNTAVAAGACSEDEKAMNAPGETHAVSKGSAGAMAGSLGELALGSFDKALAASEN